MTKYNLSMVQKISLAGILIVLTTICQKVFAVNYIPIVPFLRLSFGGPALIIFSSIVLGPWFGLLVGAASDLLGFLVFDPKLFGSIPFFQITAIYALLGFVSYFVYHLVCKIKNKHLMLIIEASTFFLFIVGITIFLCLNDSVQLYSKVYEIGLAQRIVIPILSFILLSLVFIFAFILDKKLSKNEEDYTVFHISFASFIVEISVMLIFGVLMKVWAFGSATFVGILICQILVSFFNVTLNTFFLYYMLGLSKKLLKGRA